MEELTHHMAKEVRLGSFVPDPMIKTATNKPCKEYGAPMDEQEMDRIDMAHAKYFMLLEKKRWLASIPTNLHKVLDLTCGTSQPSAFFFLREKGRECIILIYSAGIWSTDFADAHPSADVAMQSAEQ